MTAATAVGKTGKETKNQADYVMLVISGEGRWPPIVYHMRGDWIGMSVRAAIRRARKGPYYGRLPAKLNGVRISSKSMYELKVGNKLTLS